MYIIPGPSTGGYVKPTSTIIEPWIVDSLPYQPTEWSPIDHEKEILRAENSRLTEENERLHRENEKLRERLVENNQSF